MITTSEFTDLILRNRTLLLFYFGSKFVHYGNHVLGLMRYAQIEYAQH